jgi:ClpA/ClpB-like protein
MAKTLTMTPRCTAILSAAAEFARAMRHAHVGVEHLFLAMAHDPDAVPTQVLAEFVSVDDVASRLRELMASPGYTTPSRQMERRLHEFRRAWPAPRLWRADNVHYVKLNGVHCTIIIGSIHRFSRQHTRPAPITVRTPTPPSAGAPRARTRRHAMRPVPS